MDTVAPSTADISSLPSRERGLKLDNKTQTNHDTTSLPSRERGLKCQSGEQQTQSTYVAPFTGAWIEMPEEWRIRKTYPESLPSRERGLK